MSYLLDTDVISELRRPRPHVAVRSWLQTVADPDLHLSAVTIGEIQIGIEIARERDQAKAAEIEAWLDQVVQVYNVLAMDAPIFRRWARLMHHKSDELLEDAMIAATAQIHDLTVVTRNISAFVMFDVRTLNPFDARQA